MFSHQTFRVHPGRIILKVLVVIFVFANQQFLLSSSVLAQNSIHTIMKQPDASFKQLEKDRIQAPSVVYQPVIFVHGISENALDMGQKEFVPLYSALQTISGGVTTFYYVDDRAYATQHSCLPQYTPCISQSSILNNAIKLAGMISDLYQKTQHKVTLIGYSMGAAIIRTTLSGCQQNVTCRAVLGLQIAAMVNNVFFINGVQQGSWMMQTNKGGIAPVAVTFLRQFLGPLIKLFLGLDRNANAEKDLAPQSINIVSHNSTLPASNIHYFNFYGDIQIVIKDSNPFSNSETRLNIGDGVVLPGTDNPQETPSWGGARFCLQCNGQNVSQINANTTYMQWPLTTEKTIDLGGLCSLSSITQTGCVLGSLFDIIRHVPQLHTNIPSTSSLDGTDIQVTDTTGLSGSPTTGIANEIALQLQAQHNVYVSSQQDGNIYALNASTGKTVWQYSFGSLALSPLHLVDNVVYFILDEDINTNPNATSTMYELNAQNGTTIRHFQLPYFTLETGAFIPPFTVSNGTIFFSSPQMAFAVNSSDGTLLWQNPWFGRGASDPIVVNNAVYYVTGVGVIYAFKSTDGGLLWKYDLGLTPLGSIMGSYPDPVIINNSLYLTGWYTDSVYAISLDTHAPRWHIHLNNEQTGSIYTNGQNLFVTASTSTYAINPVDGTELWQKANIDVLLANNNLLYAVDNANTLKVLQASDGNIVWQSQITAYHVITTADTLFVSDPTSLYAFPASGGSPFWMVSISYAFIGEAT